MHHLPTGTVTFLFTDIEGSTRLLQQLGDRYASVLTETRQLLRTAFQQWHGHEVDTQGDAFFVAFVRATDAVAAAVAAQRALAAHAWPEDSVVRVRMGLHTGEPSLIAEGYVGIDVHHAARIMSAGHGGQVLISQATRDLVASHLPDGVSLHDLGKHRLKDLQSPVHLFQLVIAGLPADFPPLKTLDTSLHNLPIQPTPFIGREKEVSVVKQLVRSADVRLLTLTGPGGTGKTRLALQVAAELNDLFTDGIYFVDLAPIGQSTFVLPAVVQTLGLRGESDQPPLTRLKEELQRKHVLLLLDNFEQVMDAAVEVADLLVGCPYLKVIVTSRVLLHIRAEYEFIVPPLSLPDPSPVSDLAMLSQYESVTLFLQRARAANPAFQLTIANAPVVAGIVRSLDGLPLAIELAAARMKLFSPETLHARLDRRLQVLTGGARDLAARQQTLRNTIEWSYRLLDEEEQRLFRRLSVFVNGCTVEAVEAVYAALNDEESQLLETLASLLDKSLLQRKEPGAGLEPRFVMLETIREYALEALAASGEMYTLHKTHAAYLLDVLPQYVAGLDSPDPGLWLNRLEQEHDNLRAALQWSLNQTGSEREMALQLAGELTPFWRTRGYFSEGRDFLERALVGSESMSPSIRVKAVYATARMNETQGDHDRAEKLTEESLELYRAIGDRIGLAYALHMRADIAWGRADLAMACSLAEESLALFKELGEKEPIPGLLVHLGSLAIDQGEYNRAYALLEESLALDREIGEKTSIAEALFNLARVCYFSAGDLVQARAFFEEGFAIYSEVDDKESIAYCLCFAGLLDLAQGNLVLARSSIEQGVTLFKEMRHRHGTATSTAALAKVVAAQDDNAVACTLYEESIAVAKKVGDKVTMASSLEGLAAALAAQREWAKATQFWGAADALRQSIGAPRHAIDRPSYEQAVAEARARLGPPAFAEAWAEGRAREMENGTV